MVFKKGQIPWNRNKVTIICKGCNNPFKVSPYRKNTAKYCSLKCKNKTRNWSEKEDNLIKKYYKKISKEELMKKLPKRTWGAIVARAQGLQIFRRPSRKGKISKKWSKREIDTIKEYYAKTPRKDLLKLLPSRNWISIRSMARKLKLKREISFWVETLKPLNLKDFEKGYLAGAIDGEGTICITKVRGNVKYGRLYPIVSIVNTDRHMLEICQKYLHGLGRVGIHTRNYEGRKSIYYLKLSKFSHVIRVLREIAPYLVVKQKQAKLMLEFLEIRNYRPHPRTAEGVTGREWEIYREMKQLNH